METILDTGDYWVLEKLVYLNSLEIYLVEGIKALQPQKIVIAGTDLGHGYLTEITEKSRRFSVVFEDVIAYQVTNESYTTRDEYDVRTNGVVSKCERSHYLDYIRSSTLVDPLQGGSYSHFFLRLQDETIDIIAEAEPKIVARSQAG